MTRRSFVNSLELLPIIQNWSIIQLKDTVERIASEPGL